ncbi:MAG TPA: pilus assembly protein PilN [Gammaproteobacteria bacterium]|nr:pilus assembly protein PilN [Gammaproteobacteria bacterium]
MAKINLVPWREERNKRRQKEMLSMLAMTAAVTLVLGIVWHMFHQYRIDMQMERNQFLRAEIAIVDQKIKEIKRLDELREKLEVRMDLIRSLQTSRPESVHLMDENAFIMPDGVRDVSLVQTGSKIELKGLAQSNAQISGLMHNVEKSAWLQKPALQLINREKKGKQGLSQFTLVYQQTRPKKEQSDESVATE